MYLIVNVLICYNYLILNALTNYMPVFFSSECMVNLVHGRRSIELLNQAFIR